MIIEFIISISIISIIFVFLNIQVSRAFVVNKYKNIIDINDYFMKKSYEWIYTDQILGYTVNGDPHIPPEELETIEKNFIKLTFDMMGPNNEKILTYFYGSRTVLINNMLMYIRDQIATDEVSRVISQKQKDKE